MMKRDHHNRACITLVSGLTAGNADDRQGTTKGASPALALGLTLVEEGMMGVPSGAITKLALPHALLMLQTSDLNSPEAKDF